MQPDDKAVWAGQSGAQVPTGARFFCFSKNVQTGSSAHSASYSIDTQVVPWR